MGLTDLLDVKVLLTGAVAWAATRVWGVVRTVQKLEKHSALVEGQIPMLTQAIERIRKELDDANSLSAVQISRLDRLTHDVDAAHDAIRAVRGCSRTQEGE